VGGWRRLHNKELHNFYTAPNIIGVIKSMRMIQGRACSKHGSDVYNILVGKPEGRRPFGRTRTRWEDNSRLDLREIGWEDVDWIYLA